MDSDARSLRKRLQQQTPQMLALLQRLVNIDSGADELGITVFEVEPTAGGSDGNFAAALGVPTLDALGPVSTDVCSRQETMDIASLADRGALFAGIVQRLATMGTR